MKPLLRLICVAACTLTLAAQTQRDGGIGVDGNGNEVLESIHVPPRSGAPFSLVLHTEWTRPLMQGGTYTVTNDRPIKRDSRGRIYEERWLLMPKSANVPPRRSYIQIYDPSAETFLECSTSQHMCELMDWPKATHAPEMPIRTEAGPLPDGRGYRTREDMGEAVVAGVPAHAYRDTIVMNAGTMGNDQPMTYTRELRYSAALGFNLSSVLQTPAVGEQRFLVTEITQTEPEERFFQPPEGYRVVDKRKQRP